MVKVQKIAPYNFEFRKLSALSSQTKCKKTSVLVGSEINVGWAFSPTTLNH